MHGVNGENLSLCRQSVQHDSALLLLINLIEVLPIHSQWVGPVRVSGRTQEDPVLLGPPGRGSGSAGLDFLFQELTIPRRNCVAQWADDSSAGVNDEGEMSFARSAEVWKVDLKARRTRSA